MVKVTPTTGHKGPRGFWVGCQPHTPAAFTPRAHGSVGSYRKIPQCIFICTASYLIAVSKRMTESCILTLVLS
jgi:hypothetical protein